VIQLGFWQTAAVDPQYLYFDLHPALPKDRMEVRRRMIIERIVSSFLQ
jgi:hypothetical protein